MNVSRFLVVVTDQVFPDVDIERASLAEIGATLHVADGSRAGAIGLSRNADALLNTYLPIDAPFIGSLQRCRIIARYGIGVDNIDLDSARTAGITVTNVPDYCTEEVATHTTALILTLVRRIPLSHAALAAGAWGIEQIRPIARLSRLTVGLLGYGRIARRVAAALHSLGASVITHDPFMNETGDSSELVTFDDLLQRSEILSLHAPLTPSTRHIINSETIARLPRGAIVVNTSRGALVALDDLIDALRSGRLAGAGLDVFEPEPPDAERFHGVPGLIATPHTAFYSEDSLRESQQKAVDQVVNVLSGRAPDYPVRSEPTTGNRGPKTPGG